MIRLLALALLALAIWRLLARRSAPRPVVTVARVDGSASRLADDDPRTAEILAVAERVAP